MTTMTTTPMRSSTSSSPGLYNCWVDAVVHGGPKIRTLWMTYSETVFYLIQMLWRFRRLKMQIEANIYAFVKIIFFCKLAQNYSFYKYNEVFPSSSVGVNEFKPLYQLFKHYERVASYLESRGHNIHWRVLCETRTRRWRWWTKRAFDRRGGSQCWRLSHSNCHHRYRCRCHLRHLPQKTKVSIHTLQWLSQIHISWISILIHDNFTVEDCDFGLFSVCSIVRGIAQKF